MKKKICYWLNSKENGIIPMRDGKIYACCTRAVPILVDKRYYYDELTLDDIQKNRIALYEAINNGTAPQCDGCNCLVEKDEEDIEIGKISYLIYHPHTTCNFKCIYCFFQHDEQLAKLDTRMTDLYAAVKNFHEIGLLKEDFSLELGGGEPLLMNNIEKTIEFLEEYYPKSTLVIVSNYALENKVNSLIEILKKRKIKTQLKTSMDCGTKESFAYIKNNDCYDTVCKNILRSAKAGIFDRIYLKYILLEDGTNTDKKNLNGFIDLCKKVKSVNKGETFAIIDADMMELVDTDSYFKDSNDEGYTEFKPKRLSKKALNAGKYLYRKVRKNVQIEWCGDRLSSNSKEALEDIYDMQISPIENIFSIKKSGGYKIFKILGIKYKIQINK